jgi:HK97 family phage portal protein
MIVSSGGAIRTLPYAAAPAGASPPTSYLSYPSAYASLYSTQPAVRTVVDFLARNVAQLGIHIFRRVSDTDRERLANHQLAQILTNPNPSTTRYRLMETLLQDLGIYFNAYWLKVRTDPLQLVRLPPEQIAVEGTLLPLRYWWTPPSGSPVPFAPTEIVAFRGYDPCDPLRGLSPLETLRRVLAEEVAAAEYRQQYWLNSARVEAVITRPSTSPKWNDDQRRNFVESWRNNYGGPLNTGKTPLLEDGMDLKSISHSARDSEYLGARKLAREEVAAAYHVPLPMVGILDHATFSNIKEQHKQLYQDALGPWLEMIVEEFERQLLPECRDAADVYVEFNLADKLKGSFEEQAAALDSLVGRPVMTPNEGRARLNLPALAGGDELGIQPGTGAANRAGAAPVLTPRRRPLPPPDYEDDETARAVETFWARQSSRIMKQHPTARAAHFDLARWNAELAADLRRAGHPAPEELAATINTETLARLETGLPVLRDERGLPA